MTESDSASATVVSTVRYMYSSIWLVGLTRSSQKTALRALDDKHATHGQLPSCVRVDKWFHGKCPVVRTRRLVRRTRSSRGRQWHTARGARARRVATIEAVAPRDSQRR